MADDRQQWPVWAVGLLLVGLAAAIVAALIWGPALYTVLSDQAGLRAYVKDAGAWAPLVIALLELTQALLAPIPGQAIEAVSGYLFGPWLGSLYAIAGLATGSLLSFLLARHVGRPLLARLLRESTLARLDELARRGGSLFFFLIWLFPFVPDDLTCLAAGLSPMPTGRFVLLMVVGRFPGVFVATWLGSQAGRFRPGVWVVALLAIAMVAYVIWRWGKKIEVRVLAFLERLAS